MKKYFFLVLFMLPGLISVAQVVNPTLKTVNDNWLAHEFENAKPLSNRSTIAGSPYLNNNFRSGKPISKYNLTFPIIPLRYNIYTDNIEYKSPENKVYVLRDQSKIKAYKIGDSTFIYSPYHKNKNKLSSGYFQVLVPGKTKGLIKYTVYLLQAHPTQPYKPAEPERFSKKIKSFYVKVGDEAAVPVSREKTIIQLFPKQKSQLSHYIKKEKIHIRKQAEFVKLINYINTLSNITANDNKQ